MTAKCISLEAAIKAFEEAEYDVSERHGNDGFSFDKVENVLQSIPVADVVEVIRCRDCRHWNKNVVGGEYPDKIKCMCIAIKHQFPDGWTGYTAPDDYCSFAERR